MDGRGIHPLPAGVRQEVDYILRQGTVGWAIDTLMAL